MKKIEGFAIVTGASRGLGAAMALRCAKDGHNVVINYTSESSREKAEEVAVQIRELGESNIRVNTIAPGMIMTDMLRNNDPAILAKNLEVQPLKFIAEPEEIADAMSYLNTACYVDGQILAVNGGWYR